MNENEIDFMFAFCEWLNLNLDISMNNNIGASIPWSECDGDGGVVVVIDVGVQTKRLNKKRTKKNYSSKKRTGSLGL